MKAIFADTFYWVALTNADDMSHGDAVAFDKSLATVTILTTDEVLTEFTTFFSGDPRQRCVRQQQYDGSWFIRRSGLFHRAGIRFLAASIFTSHVPTKATA